MDRTFSWNQSNPEQEPDEKNGYRVCMRGWINTVCVCMCVYVDVGKDMQFVSSSNALLSSNDFSSPGFLLSFLYDPRHSSCPNNKHKLS